MYLLGAVEHALEARFGAPVRAAVAAEFVPREFDLLQRCLRRGRAHDVTLLIPEPGGRLALIRKPSYPPGLFRPPSGGVEAGEAFEAGAWREAREETGLEVRLERFLLRVEARFTCAGREASWTTYVFSAPCTGGELAPVDRVEIAEARWGTVDQVLRVYRPRMLAVGSAGMRYRVDLQDAAFRLLGLADPPEPPAGRLFQLPTPPGLPPLPGTE